MNKFILLLFCFISLCAYAQQTETPTITKPKSTTIKATNNSMSQMKQLAKEDNISADNSFKNNDFQMALALYLDELSKKPEDVELRVRIGQCYLETDIKKSNAIEYFEYALAHNYKNNDIALFLGKAYMYAERFDEAITKFDQYKSLEYKHIDNVAKADKYLAYCNTGKQLKANALHVTMQNMGDIINSTKSDNIPIIDADENVLIFNSNRTYLQDYGEYLWDIYSSENKNNKWKKAHSIGSQINTMDNDFLVGTSPDVDNLIIRQESYSTSGDISSSQLVNKKFEVPSKYPAPINNEKDIETTGCLSTNGDTLFFASNRAGGFGGLDLYYSVRMGNSWGIPQNLGPTINTPENEDYPNLLKDGKTLYFASEGHDGMGGFDIYKTTLNTSTSEWGKPQNIGYPLNTTYNDYTISFTANPRYAYVAQVKDDGMGEYDIYRVIFNDVEAPITTYTGLIALGDTATAKPLFDISPKCSIKVFDKKAGTLYGDYQITHESHYVIALSPGSYSLEIEGDGFEKYKKNITIADKQPDNPIVTSDIYIKH